MLLARFDEQHRGGSLDLRLRDYCPVPVNGTVFDVAGAATFTFTVAVLLPLELGRNVTLTVQFAPGAREAGHRLFWLNWFAFAPPSPMELIVSGAVPVLVTVTTCAGLIVRMGTFPNANDVGRTWFTGATRQGHDLRAGEVRVRDCKRPPQYTGCSWHESYIDSATPARSEATAAVVGIGEVRTPCDVADGDRGSAHV